MGMAWLFWSGILLLVDGALGLLFYERWQARLGTVDLHRWIWLEIGLALLLLMVFGVRRWGGV
tara:strand:- start:8364 stop:8552 length:189 start_codon:yes stop_codon:yes gene_type:complete